MKILLAVDGSEYGDAAVDEVARRPWPEGSEIKVITVVEPPLLPTVETWALPEDYYEELEKAGENQGRATLDRALAALEEGGHGAYVTGEIIRGYPRQAILDEAERWGADLIVLGSHGYSGLTKLLLGSVSQAVASHAKCSVEIVRRHAPA